MSIALVGFVLAQAEQYQATRHYLLEVIPLLIVLALGVGLFIYVAVVKLKLNRRRPGAPRKEEPTANPDSSKE